MNWLYILGGIVFLWAVFIIRFMHNLIFKKLKFTEKIDPNLEQRFKPFVRFDREKWNIMEIYFCAVFLLPVRALSIFGGMVILVGVLNLVVGTKKNAHLREYPRFQRFIVRLFSTCVGRIILSTISDKFMGSITRRIGR